MSAFSLLDREDDPAEAWCELVADDDIGIHERCTVLYDSPQGLTLDGTAWMYDPCADAWLVTLKTCTGTRTAWCATTRLRIVCTAVVAAMCVESEAG